MTINKIQFSNNTWQFLAVLTVFFLLFSLTLPKVQAGEVSAQVHSGAEENAIGYSFIFTDTFTTNRNYRWGIGYSYLDELKATWRGEEEFFNNDNIDAFVAYRFYPRSYNSFWRAVNFEFQLGASISLTENKFVFEKFPDQEVVFSEKNDVNFMLAAVAQYQLSKETQLQVGYKYYPEFSEFDDQGSIFVGFTYQFGRKFSY